MLNINRSVKTKWLSFQPATTRVISMFPALKSCFLSQGKCLTMSRKKFNDPVSLVWIYFFESQMNVYEMIKFQAVK
jgi:hypothetical protein